MNFSLASEEERHQPRGTQQLVTVTAGTQWISLDPEHIPGPELCSHRGRLIRHVATVPRLALQQHFKVA